MEDSGAERGRQRRSLLRTLLVALAVTLSVIVTLALVMPARPVPPAAGSPEDGGVGLLTERPSPTAEAPLPDFALRSFDGVNTVRAADYAGRPLVLNFWATWCAPCVEEMPALQQAADEAGSDVAFLGVNLLDQHDKAVALVESLDVTYDLAVDQEGRLADDIGLFGMPTTLFVDAAGTIRYRHTGPMTTDQIRELTRTYLEVGR